MYNTYIAHFKYNIVRDKYYMYVIYNMIYSYRGMKKDIKMFGFALEIEEIHKKTKKI